jgi:drug/metabolite transporter (DMT)-like permease
MTAVLLALASALAFSIATVVQHRAAASAPQGRGLPALARLAGRLLRNPAWLAGQGAAVLGLALHALALRGGRVVVVQPLLSSGLVMALALGALVDPRHHDRPRPDRVEWAAAAGVAAGLAIFLVAARPTAGTQLARPVPMLVCVAGALVVAGAAAVRSAPATARHRPLWLATAAGLGFGVTGLLLKDLMGQPVTRWPFSWSLPAFLVIGAVSVLLAQWAYQAGPLIHSLPVMTVLEPLVVILAAGPMFGEWLAPGALAHAGQLLGVLALVSGVVLLSRSAARRETGERAHGPNRSSAGGGVRLPGDAHDRALARGPLR